jgi:CheY-like chemotaxis protein
MPTPLRVLIAEDRPDDAELMVYELSCSGFEPKWTRVETEKDYLKELKSVPDVILADHSPPSTRRGLLAVEKYRNRHSSYCGHRKH